MRNLLRLVLVASIAISSVFAQATDLFFSEYIEGSSNNKAIEIFNGTAGTIDLADYQIAQSNNGGGWQYWHSFPASTSIAAGDVWVIVNSSAVIAGMQEAGDESLAYPSVVHHNGNDARGLVKIVGVDTTWLDIIGIPTEDPGTGWDVAGVTTGTYNHTLVRKPGITSGDTSWTASAGTDADSSQWIVYDQNFHMLGAHNQAEVPIAAIQFVPQPDSTDASPLLDQVVTISGVITAEPYGTYRERYWFVQDAATSWSGIMVFNYPDLAAMTITGGDGILAQGDSVTVTGTVDEYYGMTEIVDATAIVDHGPATSPPAPLAITTLAANEEEYEGCLVTIADAEVTTVADDNGEWFIDDGSGPVSTDDRWGYYYYPVVGDSLASITGPIEYSYDANKVLPRLAADVVEAATDAGLFVRLQRIQQVRGSDLIKAASDALSDTSYMMGDTVTVEGIVTMPTGLSYAGDGIKFIYEDFNGGPWSGIMSYDEDSTTFPVLFEGDTVKATGYVYEYNTAPSNMTELFITQPIAVKIGDGTRPAANIVSSGDLRLPIDAEQWGTVMVEVQSSWVVDDALAYGEWSIDDGTGSVNVDDDSDSLANFVRPPKGTAIQSVTGWLYHHYGSYADSTAYKLEPLYVEDIVIGGGPPTITDFAVAVTAFGPTDAVTVSANMEDASAVASADIQYRVDGAAWTAAAMSQGTGADTLVWTGTIPATSTEGAKVEYFLEATDDGGDNQASALSTVFPDTSKKLYGYFTKAAGSSIADIQHTPFDQGASLYDGAVVTVTGVVTTRTGSAGSDFVIQDGSATWSSIGCNDSSATYVPTEGDNVTVTGTVDEEWAEWTFKYGDNTMLRDISSVTVNSSGNSVAELAATGANLAGDPEAYESVLVNVGSVTVTAVNQYDWTVSDGSGEFLIDDDWCLANGAADSLLGLAVDDVIADLSGIFNHSFGTYKIQIRDEADLGFSLGVVAGNGLPAVFSLSQNYPNPFNPATTINYTLPIQSQHTLTVYNLLGAEVATLVNEAKPAGAYSIIWNAQRFASGLYFVRLEAGDYHNVKKMILLK